MRLARDHNITHLRTRLALSREITRSAATLTPRYNAILRQPGRNRREQWLSLDLAANATATPATETSCASSKRDLRGVAAQVTQDSKSQDQRRRPERGHALGSTLARILGPASQLQRRGGQRCSRRAVPAAARHVAYRARHPARPGWTLRGRWFLRIALRCLLV